MAPLIPSLDKLFQLRKFFLFRVLLVAVTLTCLGPATAQDVHNEKTEITFGVLASEGATRTLEAWAPTVSLLNSAAQDQERPYRFRLEPHNEASLLEGLARGTIDIFLSDPAAFVTAEVEEGARAILSVAHMWENKTYNETGALVFTRSDSLVRGFEGLAGRRVMAMAPNELTGWKLAVQEARKYRLDPESIGADLLFSGGNQREVVYAVQNGLVDVGVIRAGVLEKLAMQGAINLQDFRPVAPIAHAGFPFWVSTPLFPDWVMGSMPDVPDDALGLLIGTLLSVDEQSPQAQAAGGIVWQAPQNYLPVHDLLISLHARPYENYIQQAGARIYRAYKWPTLVLTALIVLSVLFLLFELSRTRRLAETRKNVLNSEVRSKQFYRNAIEDHTVFCMLTKDGVISHVNDHFVKVLDRSRSSLVQNPLASILDEVNQELLNAQIMRAVQAGATWEGALQLLKVDGKAAWMQCTIIPVVGAANTLSEIAIVASDVTQTRAGVSEKRFNNTLELIQDQVIVLRPGTLDILHVNAATENRLISGRMGGGWKGKTAASFITNEDFEALKQKAVALANGPERRMTWEVAAKGDVTYEISLEYAQPDQEEPRLIAIYRDISERKEIEKAKTAFIATISHELRTPLTSIKGALGLTLSGAAGEMPSKMNNLVTMAASNCERLITLINDILDLEKIEAGKMDYKLETFDLGKMLTTALDTNKFYADKFGVAVRRLADAHDGPALTFGDPTRLTQVIDNLMSNAAKFSDAGSEIQVSLKEIAGRWRISIRDFGEGIPKHAQPTMYDKFTQADSSDTRSKGGTGLGLSIVKTIVEQHQGRISFVSEEGVGTEFFVDLPVVIGETVMPIPEAQEGIETPQQFSIDAIANEAPTSEVGTTGVDDAALKQGSTSGQDTEFTKSHSGEGIVSKFSSGGGGRRRA
jgi:PAS domain S-box-containing protein